MKSGAAALQSKTLARFSILRRSNVASALDKGLVSQDAATMNFPTGAERCYHLPMQPQAAAAPAWRISVRELVEFIARKGNLARSASFRPLRAWHGIRLHQRIQKSRPSGYQAEVWLAKKVDHGNVAFEVRGRVDGIWPTAEGTVIEEIKSTVGGSGLVEPDPAHWAQAMVYGFFYAEREGLARADVQLTYIDVDTGEVVVFRSKKELAELAKFFDQILTEFGAWAQAQVEWLRSRDESLRKLTFPFSEYRAGQRTLAAAGFRALTEGGKLFAEAPTGVGKTISFLFPALKALARGCFEKIVYLTATTVGRGVVEATVDRLRERGLKLRSVTITARDKICFGPSLPCDPQQCRYALGYYDRIKEALQEALQASRLTRVEIERIAQTHRVCPFELSLDLLSWADLVICDYNYVFDPSAQLRRFLDEHAHVLLVDEAHNLVERGRAMFSAELAREQFRQVCGVGALPNCQRAARKVIRFMDNWAEHCRSSADEPGYSKALPQELLPVLRQFLTAAENSLAKDPEGPRRETLLDAYFAAARFARCADWYDERFVCLFHQTEDELFLRAVCLDPGLLLKRMAERAWAALFFSATLSPLEYFWESLGGEKGDPVLRVASPFPAAHLKVIIADEIRTTFHARAHSYPKVAEAISDFVKARTGNYLVYFPSYAYLTEVRKRFEAAHPELAVLSQRPGMAEDERRRFMDAFRHAPETTVIGFAVLGGIFGEGIDLVGDRLIGTVVVGLGLPQLSLERNLIRSYFNEKNGMGFEFAYLYPGVNRVLQAAGRVIRSEADRGIVLLIDARLREERYRELLPAWWRLERTEADIGVTAQSFWRCLDAIGK